MGTTNFNSDEIFELEYSFLVKHYYHIGGNTWIQRQIDKLLEEVYQCGLKDVALSEVVRVLDNLFKESSKKNAFKFLKDQVKSLLEIIKSNEEKLKTTGDLIKLLGLENKNEKMNETISDVEGQKILKFNDKSIFDNNTNFFKKLYYIEKATTGNQLEINEKLKEVYHSFQRKEFNNFVDNLKQLEVIVSKYEELKKLKDRINVILETIKQDEIRTINVLIDRCNRNRFHYPKKSNSYLEKKEEAVSSFGNHLPNEDNKKETEDISIASLLENLKKEYEVQVNIAIEESRKTNNIDKIVLELFELLRINYGKIGEKRLKNLLIDIRDLDFLFFIKELISEEKELEEIEKIIINKVK